MQINSTNSLLGLSTITVSGSSSSTLATSAVNGAYAVEGAILGNAFSRAMDAGEALAKLDELIGATQSRRYRAAWTASTSEVRLGSSSPVAASLRSGEEVNATPTSFTPFGPGWDLPTSSTVEPTLDGIYNGFNGSGTLTFEARKNADRPGDNLQFRVYDPGGNRIDTININKNDSLDTQYTLSNGLILTLGTGSTKKNDTFSIEIFADTGSVVDPDKAMDGIRNNNPNLQYGLDVIDGSFDVNGVSISVNASDSINDVLARITASSAGVTAVFDGATEQVVLTQKNSGSAYDVTLANDTSGFLTATKLDDPDYTPGSNGSIKTALALQADFASVVSGTFAINGVDIALDVATDSLEDIIASINASEANVLAQYTRNRVFIESNARRDALILDDGGTGLFDALHINEGRYNPKRKGGINQESASAIAAEVRHATAAVGRVLDSDYGGSQTPREVRQLQSQLRGIIDEAQGKLEASSQPPAGIDLQAMLNPDSVLQSIEVSELAASLQIDFASFKEAFGATDADARDGFVRQLLDILNQFTVATRRSIGDAGFLAGLSV